MQLEQIYDLKKVDSQTKNFNELTNAQKRSAYMQTTTARRANKMFLRDGRWMIHVVSISADDWDETVNEKYLSSKTGIVYHYKKTD